MAYPNNQLVTLFPMARGPEATKRRIFEAAIDEFARRGIAGARVDRIRRAAANKQLIYA